MPIHFPVFVHMSFIISDTDPKFLPLILARRRPLCVNVAKILSFRDNFFSMLFITFLFLGKVTGHMGINITQVS